MKTRRYFLLTAISGMFGMAALIAHSLFKHWIAKHPPSIISQKELNHFNFLNRGLDISLTTSQVAIAAFIVFLILYLAARRKERTNR